jgi:peptide-methionine (R)-S-oxide reductase
MHDFRANDDAVGAPLAAQRRGGRSDEEEWRMTSQQQQPRVQLSDDEWRKKLNPQEFDVLRRAGTERPFTGEYTDTKTEGVYQCRACGAELFRSSEKFESHCGWPSFFDPADSDAVILRPDHSMGTVRTEVLCANCHSHLGHVFAGEGYPTPTDQRYCINSISLRLVPTGS